MSYAGERIGGHPVADFVYAVNAGAAELGDCPLWSLSDSDVADLVEAAARAEAQLAAVKLRLVAEADRRELAAKSAAASTQVWLRGRCRVTPRVAKRDVVLATALERPELARTRVAMVAGSITVGQAHVIAQTLADLPVDQGPVAVGGEPGAGHALSGACWSGRRRLMRISCAGWGAGSGRWSTRTRPTPKRLHSSLSWRNAPTGGVS